MESASPIPAFQPEVVWEMKGNFIDLDRNDFKCVSISAGQEWNEKYLVGSTGIPRFLKVLVTPLHFYERPPLGPVFTNGEVFPFSKEGKRQKQRPAFAGDAASPPEKACTWSGKRGTALTVRQYRFIE